jgi:type IV secretory pathway VirB4 component
MPPNNQFPNQTPAIPAGSGPIPQAQGSATSQPAPKPKNANSTQNSLLLSEIRDNMVIMADGSFRAVVACKSINFDLMSSREREGVEYSYQNFLNALNHPIQILIRSQRIDIGPYIDRLIQIRRNQDNMLLNVLMDDYINFIDILSQEANIMDKSFFITIPYYPQGDITNLVEQGKGFFGKLFAKPNTITKIDTETYEKAKIEIKNRVDSVMAGLFQIGVQSVQLNTKELGEMYYNFYNPDTAVREPLGNFEDTTALFVKKGQGEAPVNQLGGTF